MSSVQPATGGDQLRVGGDELSFLVTSEESGGALLALEVRLPAGGGPPFLHRHDAAEVYRLDEGELAVYVEDEPGAARRRVLRAGDVIHIPGGRAHTVRNESGVAARAYVVFVPGAGIERFVRAAAAAGPDEIAELAERHGIEMAGPV
jgi:oxalate decarboxylase/phosphoglucose isomerase-like protein (cupin superfamily)